MLHSVAMVTAILLYTDFLPLKPKPDKFPQKKQINRLPLDVPLAEVLARRGPYDPWRCRLVVTWKRCWLISMYFSRSLRDCARRVHASSSSTSPTWGVYFLKFSLNFSGPDLEL